MSDRYIDDPIRTQDPSEKIVGIEGQQITPELGDEEILKTIKIDQSRYKARFANLQQINKENEAYWSGNQVDEGQLKAGESNIHVNRILVSIETIISIITQEVPPPWVQVTPKSDTSRKLQSKIERQLRDLWEFDLNMQEKLTVSLRNYFMARVGFVKVFWDDRIDEIGTEPVRLERLSFDLDAPTLQDSSFIIESKKGELRDLKRMFGKKKEVTDFLQGEIDRKGERSKVDYIEYWGTYVDEKNKIQSYVCWKYRDQILGKDFNPFWNRTSKNNHFKRPKMPYISLNSLNTGKSTVDDTSIVEQARPLQDIINKRKRQIDKNAWLANGIIVTSAEHMSKENFDSIDSTTDKVFLDGFDGTDVTRGFVKVTGRSLEGGIFDDMFHSIREIDNLFGAHDSIRGERLSPETLGGRNLLIQGDLGRQEILRRAYEQMAENIYNWWLQIMMVKYKGNRDIISSKEEIQPEDQIKQDRGLASKDDNVLNLKDFEGFKVRIIVKQGTTRPKDPESLKQEALTLRQTGMLNPITFFEMWGAENPKKQARREFLWGTQPDALFPELQGESLIEPLAIQHIRDMNDGVAGAEDQLFEDVDLNNLEDFQSHLQTHAMYMRQMEVDSDLDTYDSLTGTQQEMHKAHVALEQARLEEIIQQVQADQEEAGIPLEPEPDLTQG